MLGLASVVSLRNGIVVRKLRILFHEVAWIAATSERRRTVCFCSNIIEHAVGVGSITVALVVARYRALIVELERVRPNSGEHQHKADLQKVATSFRADRDPKDV